MQCFLLHLENRKRSAEIVSFKSDTELRCTQFCTSTLPVVLLYIDDQ
jgi:hypothetical protein